ncbi:hypothetical protein V6X63_03365 [Spiribacter sp. 221]|uniref:hypothetical protein n=1 Tax=Spiribacter onubensis TaxID=3122420 RepID=UPI00349F3C26
MRLATRWRLATLAGALLGVFGLPSLGQAEDTEQIVVDTVTYTVSYASGDRDVYTASPYNLSTTSWYGNATLAESLASQSTQDRLVSNDSDIGAVFVYDFITSNNISIFSTGDKSELDRFSPLDPDTKVTFAYESSAPSYVPEIDGAALAKGALAIAALGLWAGARRRDDGEAAEARPCV